MTNKDLLEAMQHLGAKYTDEADARAARHAAGFDRKPLMPAFTVLAGAAACAAILVGVIHMGSAGEQMQMLSQDISAQIALETEPAEAETTAAPERAASAQTTAVTVTAAEVSDTKAAEPKQEEVIQTTRTEADVPSITTQTEPTAVQQPAQTKQTLPDLSEMLENILANLSGEPYEKPILVADQISGHAGETVAFSLYVEKNLGINWFGIELDYDTRLLLETNSENIDDVTYQTRELPEDGIDVTFFNYNDGKSASVTSVFVWDLEEWRSNEYNSINFNYDEWYFIEGDGMLITYYFDIPADAKSGTVYDMTLNALGATTNALHDVGTIEFEYRNGSITVL